MVKLSDYCKYVKPFLQDGVRAINTKGYVEGYNRKVYDDVDEYRREIIDQLYSVYTLHDNVENDVSFSEAVKLAGVFENVI